MRKMIWVLLLCISCKSTAPVTVSKKNEDLRPDWLKASPDSGIYYVGIGHSAKDGTNNYIQAAKKSALDDIISQIKVNVQSTSTLSQFENNKQMKEQYEQIIQTTATEEDLEEFEQVDSWEDGRNYWVYYRLSKQRYKEIKEERKRNAVTLALDFFTKARAADKETDLPTALGLYYQGFRAVEKYLSEPIHLEFEGKDIILTNEIINSIQSLLNKIDLTAKPDALKVNRRMASNQLSIQVTATQKGKRLVIPNLSLLAKFEKGGGDLLPLYKTNDNGQAQILLNKITARDTEQLLVVSVNPSGAADESPIYKLIATNLVKPKASILLQVQKPLVYVRAAEATFGAQKQALQITNQLNQLLTEAGFDLADDPKKAELQIDVQADTEKGAQAGSVFIAYLTATIKVKSLLTQKEIYSTTIDRAKGYSLDYDRASQQAYNEGINVLKNNKWSEILNNLLL